VRRYYGDEFAATAAEKEITVWNGKSGRPFVPENFH